MTSPISPEGTLPGDLPWSIEYDNDTGPNDEHFHQWWTVTNGEVSFKCDAERDAKLLLVHLLATLPELKQRVEELESILERATLWLQRATDFYHNDKDGLYEPDLDEPLKAFIKEIKYLAPKGKATE